MINHVKNYAVAYSILLISTVLSLYAYFTLPEVLIIQWDIYNQPANEMPKDMFVLGYPVFAFLMTWFMIFVTNKSLNESAEKQSRSVITYISALIGFISIATQSWLILINAAMIQMDAGLFVTYLFSGILVFLGNIMGKVKPNKYVGFRVSWTMNSDENWHATHRFGGKIMMLCGVMMFTCSFISSGYGYTIGNIVFWWLLGLFSPFVYSYKYAKKQKC